MHFVIQIGQQWFLGKHYLILFTVLGEPLHHAPLAPGRKITRQFRVHPLHGFRNFIRRNAARHHLHYARNAALSVVRQDERQSLNPDF